jgi:hypothetical protein
MNLLKKEFMLYESLGKEIKFIIEKLFCRHAEVISENKNLKMSCKTFDTGQRHQDHRDLQPKNGDEDFYQLPNFNEKEQMAHQ